MIGNCLAISSLGEFFGQRISVDEVRSFKPSPLAYRHAAERLAGPAGRADRPRHLQDDHLRHRLRQPLADRR
ncbi:MAG TPA: hypothetical protein VHZ03_22015 [Trebonia sp.]|jgi:beta-phosphoglucomutase-like phosphatase (HAD superfamily)|nr:hypothetical protein [Trebonia sp.]